MSRQAPPIMPLHDKVLFVLDNTRLMQHHQAVQLLNHPGLRLLRARNAPLLIGFLSEIFKSPHRASIGQDELETRLKDHLFHLHESLGEERYPGTAKAYLDEWVQQDWLRRYYLDADEPEYELTAEVDQALTWLLGLERRVFVGTESRLQTIFVRLRDISEGTDDNLHHRLHLLERQQQVLLAEMARLQQGEIERLDKRRVLEYWQEARETAVRLLSDFREVEANFRRLDQRMRQQIAASSLHKGEVLEGLFAEQDRIRDSEQGQSFAAFWEFLMDPLRQQELGQLLATVQQLPELSDADDEFMSQLNYNLVQAAARVKATQNRLFTQLRRFLLSRRHLEQKMLTHLLSQLEARFLENPNIPSGRVSYWSSEDLRPELRLLYERQFWQATETIQILTGDIVSGQTRDDWQSLLAEYELDPQLLRERLQGLLSEQPVISLEQILERWPVSYGVQELLSWLQLALDDPLAYVNYEHLLTVEIQDPQQAYGVKLLIPSVIFTRSGQADATSCLEPR